MQSLTTNELDILIEQDSKKDDHHNIQAPMININLISERSFPNIDELIQSTSSVKNYHPNRPSPNALRVENFLISMTPTAQLSTLSPTRVFSPELSEISVLDYKHSITLDSESDSSDAHSNISHSSDGAKSPRPLDDITPLSTENITWEKLGPPLNLEKEKTTAKSESFMGYVDKVKSMLKDLIRGKDEPKSPEIKSPIKSDMYRTVVYKPKGKGISLEEIQHCIKLEASEVEFYLETLMHVFENSHEKLKKNKSISLESCKSLEDVTLSVNLLKKQIYNHLRNQTQVMRDKYQIWVNDLVEIDLISESPFGEVYRAFDKSKKEFYTLKRIRKTKGISESQFEIHALKQLLTYLIIYETQHPDLLKIYAIEYDIEANEYDFVIEMGYGTLRTFIDFVKEKNIAWTSDIIKSFGLQMNHQVQVLNKLGLCHRDIKPDNIIITKDLRFKLSNFDCVTIKSALNIDDVYEVIGTPYYMAPEIRYKFQKGLKAKYDLVSADIYSIAATICEMLTSNEKMPEENINYIPKVYDLELCELVNQIFMQRKFSYTMKESVYMDLFSKHKHEYEDFYKNQLLEKFLSEDRLLKERRLLKLGLFSDIKALLLEKIQHAEQNYRNYEACVLKINLAQFYKEQKNVDECFKLLEQAKKMIPKHEKMMNIYRLKVKAELFRNKGRTDKAMIIYKRMKKLYSKYFSPKELFMADLHNSIASIYKEERRYLKCVKHYSKALQIYVDHSEHKHPEIGSICEHIGLIYEYQKNYKEARKYYDRALKRSRAAFSDKHPKVGLIYGRIGVINLKEKKWTEAMYYQQKALDIHCNYSGPNSRDTAGSYAHIATIYTHQKRYVDAINYYFNAIEIYLSYGENQKEVAILCEHIGNIYCKLGRHVESLPYFRKALETKREIYKDIHPEIALSFALLGEVHYKAGNTFEAIQNYVNALEVDSRVYGENNPKIGHHHYNLGKTYEKKGDRANATKNYQAALDIYMINYLECRNELAKTYTRLGCVFEEEGKSHEALQNMLEAYDIFVKQGGEDVIEAGIVAYRLGNLYQLGGKKQKAIEYYEKALEVYSKHYGVEHAKTGEVYGRLGKILEETGKKKEGFVMMERSLSIKIKDKTPKNSTKKYLAVDW